MRDKVVPIDVVTFQAAPDEVVLNGDRAQASLSGNFWNSDAFPVQVQSHQVARRFIVPHLFPGGLPLPEDNSLFGRVFLNQLQELPAVACKFPLPDPLDGQHGVLICRQADGHFPQGAVRENYIRRYSLFLRNLFAQSAQLFKK
ncbi:MAG: hypothetical protein A4E56_02625 [Pelotomaculum sp. PtaU1.Bin065]|nr:MAG: hypothetical protein A4E56_02625 [Pelotomaculum sp. PtaU1.Bin065]